MSVIRFGLFTLCLALIHNVSGQNLVINPSFELGASCDGSSAELDSMDSWRPLAGSPRFINPKCPLSVEEKAYVQAIKMPNALEGNAYIGMGIDREGEYLEGRLSDTLKAGKQYWVKLRIRLPLKFCNTAIDELGVVLTDSSIIPQKAYTTLNIPSLKLVSNDMSPIEEQLKWQEISALYVAKGGEDKIIIGNFADNNVSNFEQRDKRQCTYAYIDLVEVSEYKKVSLKNYTANASLNLGDQYTLKDIEFEPGLAKLKSGFATLDALAQALKENKTMRLEISGHTDNVAEEPVNLQFSKARAEAIANYLIAQGVASSQLLVVGKGSSMNISVNNSESGRSKNNRIEIKVLK